MKYVKKDPRNGNLIYRRRTPKALQGQVLAGEIVRVLGKTTQEAVVAYGPVHRQIEHMLALAKSGVAGLSPAEQRERLITALKAWNADPFSPGRDDHERTWRAEAAEKLIAPFEDPETGTCDGIPDAVDATACAFRGDPVGDSDLIRSLVPI